jgi:hypothetical protein
MVDQKQIAPHVSVWDKTQRHDETLSSSDFQWDEQADEYRCPQGNALASSQLRRYAVIRLLGPLAVSQIYRDNPSVDSATTCEILAVVRDA